MSEDDLRDRIKEITVKHDGDDEAQHSLEDTLHQDLIKIFCPDFVKRYINELNDADFSRWCA